MITTDANTLVGLAEMNSHEPATFIPLAMGHYKEYASRNLTLGQLTVAESRPSRQWYPGSTVGGLASTPMNYKLFCKSFHWIHMKLFLRSLEVLLEVCRYRPRDPTFGSFFTLNMAKIGQNLSFPLFCQKKIPLGSQEIFFKLIGSTFYPTALQAGGVLSRFGWTGGRSGRRLPNLRNPYLCNCLMDFLHSKFCGIV